MQQSVVEQSRGTAAAEVAVSIVMPCLNEVDCLAPCIANAHEALRLIAEQHGLSGEVVIADNGSTDGSQELARSLGARVVDVAERGYGAALIHGFRGAHGRFLVMGDSDGSYDFTESAPMIGRLLDGADLCMGSRFKGGIKPGAMPWKNRYIGNPALTGILNLFFRTGVGDAHCGLRAIRRECFDGLGLSGTGMEFASEMVIKASLKGVRIDEVPATLSPDLRQRPPHLRPWRDGWRHLRYLFMLSPTWAFAVPAAVMLLAGLMIFALVGAHALGLAGAVPFGDSWTVFAGALCAVGQLGLLMALVAHMAGARGGYRRPARWLFAARSLLTFESFLLSGLAAIALAVLVMIAAALWWSSRDFAALPTVLPIVLATLAGQAGLQLIFAGFLLAVTSGHQADFLGGIAPADAAAATARSRGLGRFLQPVPAYTLAAVFCAAVHNAIMIGLDAAGMHYSVAQLASALVLLPLGYFIMSRPIFGVVRSWAGFGRYSLALITNYPVQFALLWLLRDYLALPMAISAPASTVLLFLWNYAASFWALGRRATAA